MAHRKNSQRYIAERQAVQYGTETKYAIAAGDAVKAGALGMFAIRWAKRSLGSSK